VNASVMTSRIDSKKAFGYFGLLIGTLPPFALVLRAFSEIEPGERLSSSVLGFLGLLTLAGVLTGLTGYVSRKFVSSAVDRSSRFRLPNRILMLSLIGAVWGAVSGAVGGLALFVIGSIFAGITGAVVGAVALPLLIGLRSLVGHGDFIEMRHFLPIAFGITFTLCALILGL
jgi:hypothetical protein